MVLVKTRKVGRTLYGCVPEYIEASAKSACEGSKVAELCLVGLAHERTACALLVEVHADFLRIEHAALYGASHLPTGEEGCETCAVLNRAVDVVELVTKELPSCFNRNSRVLHADVLLDELLLLVDVLDNGVTCLAAIHHELIEGTLYLDVHVELSCIVFLNQAIENFRIYLQEVLVELDCVVRTLSYPHCAVGIHRVTKEVTQHELWVTSGVEG